MPQIKDIKKTLIKYLSDFKTLKNIDSLYLWGSFANNYHNDNFRVRDIDIIAMTDLNSEDLLAIDDNIIKDKLSEEDLENQGFMPDAVKFSQNFIKLQKYNIDYWITSADDKLLHWGPIPSAKEEFEALNNEASNHAFNITGYHRESIGKVSQNIRDNWYHEHKIYLQEMFEDMPSGWYLCNTDNINDIVKDAISI